MKPHLLRVELAVVEFEVLVAALRHGDRRVGWLDLGDPDDPTPAPIPEPLAEAADLGVLRAVAVSGRRTVVVKPMRGTPVLGDLLREHFRGCVLVLVRGAVDAPRLAPTTEGGWLVTVDGQNHRLTTESLVARLARPRPWGVSGDAA